MARMLSGCLGLVLALAVGQIAAQDHLYMLGTTIPAEADRWYQSHYGDSVHTSFETTFARVYAEPDTNGTVLGEFLTRAVWEPYLHMSWVFRDFGTSKESVWREDVGDWGYSVNQFVLATDSGWVQLPSGPYGDSGWVRLVGYQETDGFSGSVNSVVGDLLHVEAIPAERLNPPGSDEAVTGVVFVESIDSGAVIFRREIPTDMPCGEDIDPAENHPVERYRAPVSRFLSDEKRPKFRLAYPKGC